MLATHKLNVYLRKCVPLQPFPSMQEKDRQDFLLYLGPMIAVPQDMFKNYCKFLSYVKKYDFLLFVARKDSKTSTYLSGFSGPLGEKGDNQNEKPESEVWRKNILWAEDEIREMVAKFQTCSGQKLQLQILGIPLETKINIKIP